MKRRVFYVINLDRRRILLLIGIFTGFILLSFFSGYRMGTDTRMESLLRLPETATNPDGETLNLGEGSNEQPIEEPSDRTAQFDLKNDETTIDPVAPTALSSARNGSGEEPPSTRKKRGAETVRSKPSAKKREAAASEKESKSSKKPSKSAEKKKSPDLEEPKRSARPDKERQNPRSAVLDSDSVKLANRSEKAESKATFALQIGAFHNRDAAKLMLNDLKMSGFSEAYISESGDSFRVRLGRGLSESEAETLQKSLKGKRFGSYRVKN